MEANEAEGGLSTEEAFDRLLQELTAKLEAHYASVGKNWSEILRSSLSSRSRHTTITWGSLLILLVESIIIFILYSINYSHMWSKLLAEGIVMLFILFTNVGLVIWENYQRVNELPVKLNRIINQLKDVTSEISWDEKNYPDLYMPVSPCISLQWCYRDGRLVNLPWALLVPGDIIVLQPAQKIIVECRLINDPDKVLTVGEIYSPPRSSEVKSSKTNDDTSLPPRLHPPLPKCVAVVTSSPYVEMVDISLKKFLLRPPSFYNKERHTVVARIIECILLPFAIMSFVALCLVRMFYLPHWLGIRVAPWADIILLQPMANTFPLIPVALPFMWTLLQCIGNSRLWKGLELWGFDKNFESGGMGEKVVLNPRRQQCRNIVEHWHSIRDFFLGRQETLHRSQKVLHVLASTTALCCVDKKGILSWPNPTADKLFFFRTVPAQPAEQGKNSQPSTKVGDVKPRRKSSCPLPSLPPTTIGEVLDITIDNNNELHFDDTQWENHMPNLKPIGLNILLNTCNHETREAYSSFHSHITHELFCNKNTTNSQGLVVPVTSRRCLCEVAKMIGFADKATNAFSLEQELCCFRHIESDQVSRNKLTKAKIKFPFPHLMSIVVRERASQSLQLLTQGTGDIILDVCEDFWDGKDLRPMSDSERKLISDFYQRSSLSSICTAFAYKPISSTVSPSIASLYMELPASKGLRYFPYNAAFPHLRDIDFNKTQDLLNLDGAQDSYISTDCLLADGNRNTDTEISDVQGYLQMQTGQIFLGMVTMQYQACMDIVQLIEQLDQGCIRFVHFSKENELRSRVFSEKMGLESGWNCHISLSAKVEEACDSTENTEQMDDSSNFNKNVPTRDGNLPKCKNNRLGNKRSSYPKNSTTSPEEAALLPRCSASVPEMILLTRSGGNGDFMEEDNKTEESSTTGGPPVNGISSIDTATFEFSSDEEETSTVRVRFEDNSLQVDQNTRNQLRSPSVMDSCSSAVLSPDSFQEVYEMVEHPTPLGFDMSNTAQLPVGIENIRPHLENVDNVPLLVSLFTDCNADNTCDMITIMQDYGEVTLLLGSVMNVENKELFVQADASVAIEPMYPQCCNRNAAFVDPANGNPSPTDIAMLLTSLPCSLSLKRKDCSILYDLIAQSRHFMNKCVRNSIQFWICCNMTVTVLGLLSLGMLLPPLFSLSDSMWLSCIIIPMLTIGLAFSIMSRVDISVMNSPSWKNQMVIDKQMIMYAFWCYGMKFIPSIINVTFMAAFNLRWICQQLPNATCSWVYPITTSNQASGDIKTPINPIRPNQCISTWSCENFSRLLYVQQFSMFFLVLYFVVISACFVYRSKYLWMRNPTANKVWVGASVSVLLVQTIYSLIKVNSTLTPGYDLLPAVSYAWGFVWAPVALAINELIRRHEIRINIRYEKRARLDFGTKLGMNSPF